MTHIKLLISGLGYLLSRYGGWGLFTISYLDSSFLAFPVINDLLLINLASKHPQKAIFYTLQCTLGSLLGALTLYYITRKGRNMFSPRTPQGEKTRVRHWIEQNDFISLLIASLLPPPTPFKVFAIMSGAMQIRVTRFVFALLIGRGIRFALEAWVGVFYGAAAQAYLRRNIFWLSVGVIVVAIGAAVVYRYFKKRLGAPDSTK